jgi:hypothetical protein
MANREEFTIDEFNTLLEADEEFAKAYRGYMSFELWLLQQPEEIQYMVKIKSKELIKQYGKKNSIN